MLRCCQRTVYGTWVSSWTRESSMRPHINEVSQSVHYRLRCISRIQRYLDDTACAIAVQAYVVSRLDYANSVLAGVPDSELPKLQVAQNRVGRLVSQPGRREHIAPVLPVRQRTVQTVVTNLPRTEFGHCPSVPQRHVAKRPAETAPANSSALQLMILRTKKCIGDRAFSVYATRLWNDRPVRIRNTPSHKTLKKFLQTFLFRQYFSWICDNDIVLCTSNSL